MRLLRVVVLAAAVAATSGVCAACGESDEPADPPPPPPRTVSFLWKVADLNGAELACDAIDAQLVTVTFFQTRTGLGFTEVFDCFRKAGARALDEGEYQIGFELSDRFGTLVTVPSRRYEVAGDTSLEEATFRLDPFGGLVLTLDPGLLASCSGSSLITGMTIALFRADGACEPATLTIEPATPYQVNCASPVEAACIEKDRRVTGARLPAGEYRIRATALQGVTTCWVYDRRERVRAAGLGRTLVLPLTKTCN